MFTIIKSIYYIRVDSYYIRVDGHFWIKDDDGDNNFYINYLKKKKSAEQPFEGKKDKRIKTNFKKQIN